MNKKQHESPQFTAFNYVAVDGVLSTRDDVERLLNTIHISNIVLTDVLCCSLTWVPMVCVMASLFFCDMGVHPIPFIIASEYFPTNIRAQVCFFFFPVVCPLTQFIPMKF